MTRKSLRYLLHIASCVPGLYATLAFCAARRVIVRGPSMMPTLLPADLLLFDRLAYLRDRPATGDIVLVRHPVQAKLRLVKRLAGVPGDAAGDRTLLRGEYWVLGDNQAMSTDSREFGPVRRRDLLGRAWIRYWPADEWKVWP